MISWNDMMGFIRRVSRTNISPAQKGYILRLSEGEVPWENLRMIAEMGGVSGFLHVHLKGLGLLERLPDSTRVSLETGYQQTKKRTLAYITEMKRLSKLFEEARIPVAALQGLSLLSIYNDPGLRPFSDADLMVKPSQKKRLRELLQEMGYYNPLDTHPNIFVRDDVCIDLHTHVLNLERIQSRRYLFPVDLAPMWDRAAPLSDQTGGLLALDPYDNLIALSAHVLKHGYSRLIWLVDLHESLLRLESDMDCYEMIMERARFWRQERILLYALILVERIFGTKIPPRLKQRLGVKKLSGIERRLLLRRINGYVPKELFVLLFLRNIKGMANRIAFIIENIFPRHEILVQTVDDGSHEIRPAIYIKRFLEAVARVGRVFTLR